jgi:hypothetical protein
MTVQPPLKATLIRRRYKTHAFGILVVNGTVFRTLERPWLDNRSNVSCIPNGEYECSYLPRSGSGRYVKVWHVRAVPDRSGILIHRGNLVSHSKGCILVGERHGRLAGQPAVLASRTAMRKLRELVGENGFDLNIVGEF